MAFSTRTAATLLAATLASTLCAAQAAGTVDVYVSAAPGGANGFTDPGFKDRQDSAEDVRKELDRLSKKKNLRVVREPTKGAVHIEITLRDRVASGGSTSSSARVTASVVGTVTSENKEPTVFATLKVDGFEAKMEGRGDGYWSQAAADLAEKIGEWAAENRARLLQAR